jgi:hypothetical protein
LCDWPAKYKDVRQLAARVDNCTTDIKAGRIIAAACYGYCGMPAMRSPEIMLPTDRVGSEYTRQ